eukprot:Lankesteria_metandrocarpae@DN52_c0_g1_i1.p1
MFIGKIGTKSAAFINHKPFHPGSLRNLEKVWEAEQKHEKEVKEQESMLERRRQEVLNEELRSALRKKEQSVIGSIDSNYFAGLSEDRSVVPCSRKRQRGCKIRSKKKRKTDNNGKSDDEDSASTVNVSNGDHVTVKDASCGGSAKTDCVTKSATNSSEE